MIFVLSNLGNQCQRGDVNAGYEASIIFSNLTFGIALAHY
jgi:hypothetical protein